MQIPLTLEHNNSGCAKQKRVQSFFCLYAVRSIYIGCKYLPYRVDIADNKDSNGYDNYWSSSLEYGGEH